MVRYYKSKGYKRKNKEVNYDREEVEPVVEEEPTGTSKKPRTENCNEEEVETAVEVETTGKTEEANTENTSADDSKEEVIPNLAGVPVVPNNLKTKPGVIFILEKASLEVAKVGKNYALLNSEEHANFLKKNNRNPADYRPDIAFQAILTILDSPLNKAGRLRALYVKTEKGVLFEVKPYVRIPRTYKRFSGIILQLLQKLSITAVGKREKLLNVIKNPVTQYLPINSHKIGFSHSSEKLVDIGNYVSSMSDDMNLVFVVGAMAHGKIDNDYVNDYISISGYPLSAAWCISRVCSAVEHKWRIL